ncbi:MAG TPA: DUF6807 family protein [Pseudorhodoplanes sp.]|nr:DUF6807 family protein [Pseudorhodoplanes sp.]
MTEDVVALPTGAWAAMHRRTLRRNGKALLALSQGKHRAYVYPLFTPAGYAVTSEHPADHPHHNSFWFAADHVYCRMPVTHGHGYEEYTYNLYLNDTFQGRAPGRIVETACSGKADGDAYTIVQTLDWRGPAEWAAPDGRLAARETRIMRIATEATMHVIDVESRLEAVDWDFTLGPTRHAYFNMRIADSMIVALGGLVRDDRGRTGGEAVSGSEAKWIDYSGPVGGGHVAGVSVFPDPRDHADIWWFVADWGVITVGPFRAKQWLVRKGEHLKARYRVLVHDGDAGANDVAGRYKEYVGTLK